MLSPPTTPGRRAQRRVASYSAPIRSGVNGSPGNSTATRMRVALCSGNALASAAAP